MGRNTLTHLGIESANITMWYSCEPKAVQPLSPCDRRYCDQSTGEVLTDLGSGVGHRKTPFWSDMAYLTGLGSGGVQSTAGAPLTMTAIWQVCLRWTCLMFAPPLFFFFLAVSPLCLSQSPLPSLYLLLFADQFSPPLPDLSDSLSNILIFSLFITATH